MDDSKIHVEFAVVRDGATALADCGDQMSGVLHAVGQLQDDLLNVWTGPAAKISETKWATTETDVRQHIEQLSGFAQWVQSAADSFEKQSGGSGAGARNV